MTPAERQARYARTEKGRATRDRYNASAVRRATHKRYRVTAKGRRQVARTNAKRLFIGGDYYGCVESVERAEAINRHIRQRVRTFRENALCR
jgi:hypothetical protein